MQEARSMLTDMTLEVPRNPTRKQNIQEEYTECQEELVTEEPCKNLIREYQNIEEEKYIVQSINPNLLTDKDKAQMKRLIQKLSRLKMLITNYPQHQEKLLSNKFQNKNC